MEEDIVEMSLRLADETEENDSDTNSASTSEEPFDIRLPVKHQYLNSTDLGELSTHSLYVDPGSELSVPVVVIDTVLLPGQTLPLQFTDQSCVDFMRAAGEKRTYFGLLTATLENDREEVEPELTASRTGTLFQVQNITLRDQTLTVQAVGRQRCRLLNRLPFSSFHEHDFMQLKFYSMLTAHDTFSLSKSSTETIAGWLKNWLQKWFDLSRINIVMEQGYTVFSYFVASNLPVGLEEKLKFLEEDCTDRRLRMLWRTACQMSGLACDRCGDVKCEVNDLINLSAEGNGTHFVNPAGYVHDLFTVGRMDNIQMHGLPSTQFSWFPGYAWTPLSCSNCSAHLGWKFISSKLLPKRFYGISRRSFKLARMEDSTSP
ncbi:ATP-dependent protease la (LON) substrate-binding domain-containing protein [Ditylenchus destructor]|uniref:ATP-dependent protease la (LON) substrate-binding domain-containing protein n=1 Tax=Ditylenchus destructor TaxID=166010 RepID=A0AAD4N3A8_9BILA|nr:ATP-dependent protease la (LON) substrate-binding domain-containing protein [Ditylenchus destructor]